MVLSAAIAATILDFVAGSSAGASRCPGADVPLKRSSPAAFGDATLCLINRERARHGLRPLRPEGRLALAARRHSRSMVRRRYFGHGSYVARIRRTGYVRSAHRWKVGENIGWGRGTGATAEATVRGWMASAPHRRVVLGPFRDVGIGVEAGAPVRGVGNAATYTADFGRRG